MLAFTVSRRSPCRTACAHGLALVSLLASASVARAECGNFLGFLPEGFGIPDGELIGDVRVGYENDDGSDFQEVEDLERAPGPRVTNFDVTVASETGFNSTASVVGALERGFATLDVTAVARVTGTPSETGAEAGGAAGFNDVLTISSPGRNGQPGTARLGTRVDGALSAAYSQAPSGSEAYGLGGAQYLFSVSDGPGASGAVSPGEGFQACEEVFVQAGEFSTVYPPTAFVGEELGGPVNFEFGAPIAFGFRIEATSEARARVLDPGPSAVATVVGDFGNTVTWMGVLDVRDQDGNPVTDFTVTSASGTDYLYAITGPSAAPQFTAQPEDAQVRAGDAATFSSTVAGSGTAISLQWSVSTDGGATWSDIPGATASNYTTPATTLADDGRRYRLTATNDVGTTDSAVALLTVDGGGGGGGGSVDGLVLALLMLLLWLRPRRARAISGR